MFSGIDKETAKYITLGTELAFSVVGFSLLGWWLDAKFETGSTLTIVFSILGIIAGLFNFLKSVLSEDKKNDKNN